MGKERATEQCPLCLGKGKVDKGTMLDFGMFIGLVFGWFTTMPKFNTGMASRLRERLYGFVERFTREPKEHRYGRKSDSEVGYTG